MYLPLIISMGFPSHVTSSIIGLSNNFENFSLTIMPDSCTFFPKTKISGITSILFEYQISPDEQKPI